MYRLNSLSITLLYMRPTKIHLSLRICALWSESLLSVWRGSRGSLAIHTANRNILIRLCGCTGWSVFTGRTHPKVHFLSLMRKYPMFYFCMPSSSGTPVGSLFPKQQRYETNNHQTITNHPVLFYKGVCFVLSSLKLLNNEARREKIKGIGLQV